MAEINGRDYILVPEDTETERKLPVPTYNQSPDVPEDFKNLAESISTDLDELDAKDQELQVSIDGIEGNIGDLDFTDLSEQVQQNTDNIGDNDKDTDGTLKEQIDALDGRVEDNTTNINNNTGQIDQNKQDIEDNKNQIDQNTQDIADINDILADGVGETYELVQELDGIALKDSDGMYSGNVEFVAGDNIGIEYGGNDITISADPGVPLGGLDGEVLTKLSDESGDYGWMPSSGGGGGCCAASYSEERDCAADACTDGGHGGGGAACFNNYGEQKNCTPSGDNSGGGEIVYNNSCFEDYNQQKACNPTGSSEDYLVLLDDAERPIKFVGKSRPDGQAATTTTELEEQYADAPIGSTYLCVDPSADNNLGAQQWFKKDATTWVCTDGLVKVSADSLNMPQYGQITGGIYRRGNRVRIDLRCSTHPKTAFSVYGPCRYPESMAPSQSNDTFVPGHNPPVKMYLIPGSGVHSGFAAGAGYTTTTPVAVGIPAHLRHQPNTTDWHRLVQLSAGSHFSENTNSVSIGGEWDTDEPWPATQPILENGIEFDAYSIEELDRFLEFHPEYTEATKDIYESLKSEGTE